MHIFDISLIVLFLAGTIYAGFRRSSSSFSDYSIGNKTFSNFAQVATLVATCVSGSRFFIMLDQVYTGGILYLFIALGIPFSIWLTAWIFLPRLKNALEYNSITEMLGDVYGQNVRILGALMGVLITTALVAAQFKIFGKIFEYFVNLNQTFLIIIAGTIVTLYTSTGGIRSVTYTDIVQFFTFASVVPLICVFILDDIFQQNIPLDIKPQLNKTYSGLKFSNPDLGAVIFLFLYFCIPSLDQTNFQRIVIGKNIPTVTKNFLISGLIIGVFFTLIALIPMLLMFLDIGINSEDLILYLVKKYEYLGIKGLLVIGVCSMAMSTADSELNASSILFGNDILSFLKMPDSNKLLYSRIFSLVVGGWATLLAIFQNDILRITLSGVSYYMAVVTPILYLTLFGFRTSKEIILTSMLVTFCFITFFTIKTSLNLGTKYLLEGMVLNSSLVLFLHYLILPKNLGWVATTPLPIFPTLPQKQYNLLSFFKNSIQRVIKHKKDYLLLGIYSIIFAFTSLFYQVEVFSTHKDIIIPLYIVTVILAMSLILLPYFFKDSIKKSIVLNILSIVLIFSVLSFFNILLNLPSGFDNISLSLFSVNVLVLFFFLDWHIAAIMLSIGFCSAVWVYNTFFASVFGALHIGTPLGVFIYLTVMLLLILLFFIIPRKKEMITTENELWSTKGALATTRISLKNLLDQLKGVRDLEQVTSMQEQEISRLKKIKQDFLENIKSHTKSNIERISSIAEALYDDLFYYVEDGEEMKESKAQLSELILDSKAVLLDIDNIILHSDIVSGNERFTSKEKIPLLEFIKKRIDICSMVYCSHAIETEKKQLFLDFKADKDLLIKGDSLAIGHVLDNVLVFAINNSESSIRVEVQKTEKTKINITFSQPVDKEWRPLEKLMAGEPEKKKKFIDSIGYIVAKKFLQQEGGDIEFFENSEEDVISIILS